jgi:hypothetical protein
MLGVSSLDCRCDSVADSVGISEFLQVVATLPQVVATLPQMRHGAEFPSFGIWHNFFQPPENIEHIINVPCTSDTFILGLLWNDSKNLLQTPNACPAFAACHRSRFLLAPSPVTHSVPSASPISRARLQFYRVMLVLAFLIKRPSSGTKKPPLKNSFWQR